MVLPKRWYQDGIVKITILRWCCWVDCAIWSFTLSSITYYSSQLDCELTVITLVDSCLKDKIKPCFAKFNDLGITVTEQGFMQHPLLVMPGYDLGTKVFSTVTPSLRHGTNIITSFILEIKIPNFGNTAVSRYFLGPRITEYGVRTDLSPW